MKIHWLGRTIAAGMVVLAGSASAAQINVTVTNTAPTGGTFLTPVWVGFHDGTFDTFSPGGLATPGLELVAEVGQTGTLSSEFAGNGVDATLGGGPIGPGGSASHTFDLATDGSHNYLSFASMVLPSSDFFIGNSDPLANSIASILDGTMASLTILVATVYDAGTEENDFAFSAGNGLFPGLGLPASVAPDGNDQSLPIRLASSSEFSTYLNVGAADVSSLDFDNYASLAVIEVTAVPVPGVLALFGLGALILLRRRSV